MERKRTLIIFGLLILVVVVLSGCTLGNTPPGDDANNDNTVNMDNNETTDTADNNADNDAAEVVDETVTDGGMESLCANPYIPVIEGASWSYAGSDSSGMSSSFTDTITGASSTGYTLFSTFDSLTKTQTWACVEDGLVSLEYSGGGDASVSTNGLTADFETSEMSGLTVPNHIAAGDSWTQTFAVSGETVLEGGMVAATEGTVSTLWTAVGVEEVSVAAGTFEAIKVAVETTLDFTMDMEGVVVPFTMTTSGYIWLVEGVGWVKSESSYTFMDVSGTSMIELVGYSIP
jgi:hypothetical protein